MTRISCSVFLAFAGCLSWTVVVAESVVNTIVPASGSEVRLGGRIGLAADTCIRARAFSDWARGAMYEEAENAFRTHWDDTNGRENGWQNEYWGKTMLCFAGAIEYTQDPELKAWALEKAHAFVREFQKPNGYLSTYLKEDFLNTNPDDPDGLHRWGFNIWGRKYTFWALLELHRVTGDKVCLDAAAKMADHLIDQLKRLNLGIEKTGAWWGVSSGSILRPMLELYKVTGKVAYLDFCRGIVRAFDAEPSNPGTIIRDAFRKEPICTWYPRPTFWAKAYEIESCLEGLIEYHRLTGDKRVLEAVLAYHRHLTEEELNPMGSAGYFDHFLTAKNHVNGMTELCDVVHWIRLNRELLLLTGESRYADLIEQAFLNGFLAGVSRDGRWGAHIIRSHGTRHLSAPAQTGMTLHQCCPDNMMRTYFDYAGTLAAEGKDGAVSVLMYTDGETKIDQTTVSVTGGYPWSDDAVSVRIDADRDRAVRFRVPRWSKTLTVDGMVCEPQDGWVVVQARKGERVWRLGFDLTVRVEQWSGPEEEKLPASPQVYSPEIPEYTVHFMEWYTPDMAGLCRQETALRVLRGPLVLAKGRLAGTSREETLFASSFRNERWQASLRRAPRTAANVGVAQPWILVLTRGDDVREIPVGDFASVSNVDDPANWFSIWF